MKEAACHTQAAPTVRPKWELADVFRLYGQSYRERHRVPAQQIKIMRLIEQCRTAELGGHLERCDTCGYERPAYNSCRNRHCPKCQSLAKEDWLEERKRDLLPVKYFHNVFTLPHEVNPLVLDNKRCLLDMLFASAAEALQDFAHDPQWKLEGQLGFLTVLHTWSQTLMDHFHIHCVIPAGAFSPDKTRWAPCPQEDFLFPVEALSRVFRGKFLFALKRAYKNGELSFAGRLAPLAKPREFYRLFRTLKKKDWVVYSKRPFAGPEKVLEYLARYTHRVALSNERIKDVADGEVTFSYKDRSDDDCLKVTTLPADEFIRRFLLHVLPSRFTRIRHFGFLAGKVKGVALPIIRRSLGLSPELPARIRESLREKMLRLTGKDITKCPRCKSGTFLKVALPLTTCPTGGARCRGP